MTGSFSDPTIPVLKEIDEAEMGLGPLVLDPMLQALLSIGPNPNARKQIKNVTSQGSEVQEEELNRPSQQKPFSFLPVGFL